MLTAGIFISYLGSNRVNIPENIAFDDGRPYESGPPCGEKAFKSISTSKVDVILDQPFTLLVHFELSQEDLFDPFQFFISREHQAPETCEVTMELMGGAVSSDSGDIRKLTIGVGKSDVAWILTPRRKALEAISIRVDRKALVAVVNVTTSWVPPSWAFDVGSTILTMLGSFATIPWWIAWFNRRALRDDPSERCANKGPAQKDSIPKPVTEAPNASDTMS